MILHVVKSSIYSGAENVICQIINGLKNGEEFMYMAPHGPIEDKLKELGLSDIYYGIDELNSTTIKKAIEELHPSVVHAHDFTASVLCGFALKKSVPVISHIHCNPLWLKNPLHPKSISFLLASRYINQILAVSDSIKDEFVYSSLLKCPITTIGNPFSVSRVIDAVEDNCRDLHSDVLYVGRFNEAKNPLGFIKIIESYIANNRVDSLTVKMVGNGELLDDCKKYAHESGLDKWISFEGFSNNVYNYMSQSKLVLMPSIFEGFGLVALEAMALGKPVICSGVGGLSDIVNDSCGYICKTDAEYDDSIKALLNDNQVYASKSAGAIAQAKAFDNLEEYIKNIKDIYTLTRFC